MAVRNNQKMKKNRAAKTTKAKSKRQTGSTRSPDLSATCSAMSNDEADSIEVVEVHDDDLNLDFCESGPESDYEAEEDRSECLTAGVCDDVTMNDEMSADNDDLSCDLMVHESVSTINSLQASPANIPNCNDVEMEENNSHNIDVPLDGIEEDEYMEHAPATISKPTPSLFSRIFGGFPFFSRNTQASTTQLHNIPERQSPALEVIHVFPDPAAALGHEGLKKRRMDRIRRSSIQSTSGLDNESMNIPVPYENVKDIPASERVVLLRQVLSPRGRHTSQEVIVDKAAHRPDLWVFLPFSYCKMHYATELCDYLNRRCSWPSSRVNSPNKGEIRDLTPVVAIQLPQDTPLMNFVPNDIPPNSIDAPARAVQQDAPSENGSGYLPYTPMTLPTPPQVTSKKNDGIHTNGDDENISPVLQ